MLSILILFTTVGSGYYLITNGIGTNNLPTNKVSAASAAPVIARPRASQASLTAMSQKINEVIARYPGVQIAVSVTDLNTGSSYDYGVSAGYLAASTAKLLTATLYLQDVENGSHSLQETVGNYTASYQLQQMIEQSDNDAWVAFNGELGHEALQAWATKLGLTSYDADTNILSSKDVALLLTKLYQHKLLNTDHTKLLLSYMQNANETQYIESSVPANVKVYHKAGWLSDRVHDAAIIDDGKNPYVLVIFSKTAGDYDTQAGQDIFHTITDATVTTFIKSKS